MGRPVSLRALPPKSAVGAVAVIILPPLLDEVPGVCQGNENILVQAFISQPSVETFHETVIRGFSGPTVFQADAIFCAHSFKARPVNSGPLSVRSLRGRRPCSRRRSSTCTTRWPESDISTSRAGVDRSQRSRMVRIRIRRPDSRLSLTKSIPHCSSGPMGVGRHDRRTQGRFFVGRKRKDRHSSR